MLSWAPRKSQQGRAIVGSRGESACTRSDAERFIPRHDNHNPFPVDHHGAGR